jgi:signal transduction histidine kinase
MIATAAYRITQEALTNVARHAEAAHVDVHLGTDDGYLILVVSDDGKGFDKATLGDSDGLGLAGMRERSVLTGGYLKVQSQPNSGTRVEFGVAFENATI